MITQKQQDMIDAAKAFLIDFDRALSGTSNPLLNRMVTAAYEFRREILNTEELMELNRASGSILREALEREHIVDDLILGRVL